MKYLDIDNWVRKGQYHMFKQMDYPQFNICANVDVTGLYHFVKKQGLSFYNTMIYLTSRAANGIEEFRYRIRGDKVIIHDSVHPSFTALTTNDTFSFCTIDYKADFFEFTQDIAASLEKLKGKVDLHDEPDRDDLLFITCIPWVSFTSIVHPVQIQPIDSIPRISWGKYFEEGTKLKLPLSVQVNHALMDGFHAGRYFKDLQDLLDQAGNIL